MIVNAPTMHKIMDILGLLQFTHTRKAHLLELKQQVAKATVTQRHLLMTDRYTIEQTSSKEEFIMAVTNALII